MSIINFINDNTSTYNLPLFLELKNFCSNYLLNIIQIKYMLRLCPIKLKLLFVKCVTSMKTKSHSLTNFLNLHLNGKSWIIIYSNNWLQT